MSTTPYQTYTEILSKIIAGTASAHERALVSRYESERFHDWCPTCDRRLRSLPGGPVRILHDNTACKKKNETKPRSTKQVAPRVARANPGAGEAGR